MTLPDQSPSSSKPLAEPQGAPGRGCALQRPKHFLPGLRSMPWWNPGDFPEVGLLETHYTDIRAEFLNLQASDRLRLHPQSKGGPQLPIADGDWQIFDLFSCGMMNNDNASFAPRTAAILAQIDHPADALAYFSVVDPHVHIAAHCGPTNTRLRIHLGLVVPADGSIRVGEETRSWQEGKCLVFDDSWEHEITNRSDRHRAVLLVDIWHPDLTSCQRADLVAARRPSAVSATARSERNGWLKE